MCFTVCRFVYFQTLNLFVFLLCQELWVKWVVWVSHMAPPQRPHEDLLFSHSHIVLTRAPFRSVGGTTIVFQWTVMVFPLTWTSEGAGESLLSAAVNSGVRESCTVWLNNPVTWTENWSLRRINQPWRPRSTGREAARRVWSHTQWPVVLMRSPSGRRRRRRPWKTKSG